MNQGEHPFFSFLAAVAYISTHFTVVTKKRVWIFFFSIKNIKSAVLYFRTCIYLSAQVVHRSSLYLLGLFEGLKGVKRTFIEVMERDVIGDREKTHT